MAKTICYWRGSAEVREDIVSNLRNEGTEVLFVRGLEELLDCVLGDDIDAIIVDGSASQREASDRVIEITNTELLHSFAILFVSTQASKRVAVMKARIKRLFPIEVPYRTQNIIRGMSLLLDSDANADTDSITALFNQSAETSVGEILQSEQAMPILTEGPSAGSAKEASMGVASGVVVDAPKSDGGLENESRDRSGSGENFRRKTVTSNSVKNRERLKSNLDPKNLKATYGGEVLSIATHVSDFDDQLLIPRSTDRADFRTTFDSYSKLDPWMAVHSRRVAFVATALANALEFTSEQERNVRLTCLFINMSHSRETSPKMRRQDLLRCGSLSSLLDVAKAFRDSAGMIRNFGEERSAQTAELVAEILSGRPLTSLEQEALKDEAECVLVVEMADRSCWGEGHWNPFGAYQVIRHLRSNAALITNVKVKGGMARILGEAVTAHVTVGNVFMANEDLETQTAARAKTEFRLKKDASMKAIESRRIRSLNIQLADLEPGMRLAEPIKARDGKLVLNTDVVLDQELVLQVWQLAAVRALHAKIAVQVEV